VEPETVWCREGSGSRGFSDAQSRSSRRVGPGDGYIFDSIFAAGPYSRPYNWPDGTESSRLPGSASERQPRGWTWPTSTRELHALRGNFGDPAARHRPRRLWHAYSL